MKNFLSLNHPIGNRILFLFTSILFSIMFVLIAPVWFETWVFVVFFVLVFFINVWYSIMVYRVMKDIQSDE